MIADYDLGIIRRAHATAPPVDVVAIAKSMGVMCENGELDPEISGQLERIPRPKGFMVDQFKITVNKTHGEQRRRFTIAHEIGHFLLHKDLIGDGVDDNKAFRSTAMGNFHNTKIGPREEAEANNFAAQLLMPKYLLEQEIENGSSFYDLCRDFGVSQSAMEYRLKNTALSGRVSR